MDSRSSPRRCQAADRRKQALDLRKAGKNFAEIGAVMGFSEARAHKIVTLELQRLNAERTEAAAEVLQLELQRLDALLSAVWPAAQAGDLAAVGRALDIVARRCRMLGLDAPEARKLLADPDHPICVEVVETLVRTREEASNLLSRLCGANGVP